MSLTCSFQILQLTIVNSRPQSVEARVSELRTKNRPIFIIITRGEGGLRPPSPLVRVAGATLISREEGVSSDIIELSVYYFYIKSKLIVNAIL